MPISEVKAHLPSLVADVQEREEEIIVTRKGRPAVVIINFEEYERVRETLAILADAALLRDVRKGRRYFERGGKGISAADAFFTKPTKAKPRAR